MTDDLKPGYLDSLMPRIVLGRLGMPPNWRPPRSGSPPRRRYVTGQTIVVDGGPTIA